VWFGGGFHGEQAHVYTNERAACRTLDKLFAGEKWDLRVAKAKGSSRAGT